MRSRSRSTTPHGSAFCRRSRPAIATRSAATPSCATCSATGASPARSSSTTPATARSPTSTSGPSRRRGRRSIGCGRRRMRAGGSCAEDAFPYHSAVVLQPESMLGPYRIAGVVGEGGMGVVYRAKDTRLGRDVAIKVLTHVATNDREQLLRFEQEARATGMLHHPNLLTIYDVGHDGGGPYIVSELLQGETLRERLARGPLPPRRAIDAALQITQGLAAAHEKGISHRDLKPENNFLTRDGRAKILDFGIAKLTGNTAEGAFKGAATEPGMVLGTVGYMSPEQVRGDAIDTRSDIFSFGTILYEILTGERAFKGDSAIETLRAILKEDPPDLTEKLPNSQPALERLLRR